MAGVKNVLANRTGIAVIATLLIRSGAICPTCGYGTRATSKRWAKCKRCGERVPRIPMDDVSAELSREIAVKLPQRYRYLGDRLTDSKLVGAECSAVLRDDGKLLDARQCSCSSTAKHAPHCTPSSLTKTQMIALSIRQPWAWLIVHGYKDIENRDWHTRFRGRFAVHAGLAYDVEGERWIRQHFPNIPLPRRSDIERGGVVGFSEMTDCVRSHHSRWFQGAFGFVLANAAPCGFFQARGRLGFFKVDLPSYAESGRTTESR